MGQAAVRQQIRDKLLESVEQIRPILEATIVEAEALATLPFAAVKALQTSGLLAMKLPALFGGAEADPVTQLEAIEAVSYWHAAAGWCLMIGATSIALPAVFLPDEAVAQIFENGRIPLAASAVMPGGKAIPTKGGYQCKFRSSLADNAAFQQDLGHCNLQLGAARALAVDVHERAWQTVAAGDKVSGALLAEMRGSAVYATEVAREICLMAFQYGGGAALYLNNPLQRYLRDIHAASQHLLMSRRAYENHGQFLLSLPDAQPMG